MSYHFPSSPDSICISTCVSSVDGILSSLFKKVNEEKRIHVHVSRNDILWEGLRHNRRRKDLSGLLGIDTGGPRKEFLTRII